MGITYEYEALPPRSGRIVARDDGTEIGHVRWRIEQDGTWIFNSLSVDEGHQGQGVSKALQEASKARRESPEYRDADGNPPAWRSVPTTAPGTAAVNSHIRRNYDGIDPRPEGPTS